MKKAPAKGISQKVLLPYNEEEDSRQIVTLPSEPTPATPSRIPMDSLSARIRGLVNWLISRNREAH